MTQEEATAVSACLDDLSDEYRIMQREIARLEKRRTTKFYVIERVARFLRQHRDDFQLESTYPRELVENLFSILEDEGWL